jgi:hypothetical protein
MVFQGIPNRQQYDKNRTSLSDETVANMSESIYYFTPFADIVVVHHIHTSIGKNNLSSHSVFHFKFMSEAGT